MRGAVVVVLGVAACGRKTDVGGPPIGDAEPIHANPPAPVPPPDVPVPPPPAPPPAVLNGVDDEQRLVFRSNDGTCHVNLPPAPPQPGRPVVSFQPPIPKAVPCPPHMVDASWAACANGVVRPQVDGSDCSCAVLGNPPPPPRSIPCPTASQQE